MIRFPGVYLWDLRHPAPCKSPRLRIFQRVSVPPDLIVENGIRETFFLKSGCRRTKPLSRSCAGLQKKPIEKFMGLKTGSGSCRPSIWGLAQQWGQIEETAEEWELREWPGTGRWECRVKKREAVGRRSIWDKEPAGKHRDEVQQKRFLRGGNRTNVTAGEIWLQRSRAQS